MTAAALRKRFNLDFECGGAPYVWRGRGVTLADAEAIARRELAHRHPLFDRHRARLVAVVQDQPLGLRSLRHRVEQ